MKVKAYCLDWHLRASPAFHILLVDALRPWAEIELVAWDGQSRPRDWDETRQSGQPVIFCQKRPPRELLRDPRVRAVWLPMWNNIRRKTQDWWREMPSHLRVVSFSNDIRRMAEGAGLRVFDLRFHFSPSACQPAHFGTERILYYWDRVGLATTPFLERVCSALRITRLLLRRDHDPGSPREDSCQPPPGVETLLIEAPPNTTSQSVYLGQLALANMFLGPRPYEGVGLTNLEALARGCFVLAADHPTMNEYITPGVTGWLFPTVDEPPPRSRWRRLLPGGPARCHCRYSPDVDWDALARLDLSAAGAAARQAQEEGHARWQRALPRYADFVLHW